MQIEQTIVEKRLIFFLLLDYQLAVQASITDFTATFNSPTTAVNYLDQDAINLCNHT